MNTTPENKQISIIEFPNGASGAHNIHVQANLATTDGGRQVWHISGNKRDGDFTARTFVGTREECTSEAQKLHDALKSEPWPIFEDYLAARQFVQRNYWVMPVQFAPTPVGDRAEEEFNSIFFAADHSTAGKVHYAERK